ncbi:urease accessory protein UreD [Streptomyces sp. NPDC048361]|uniref:urease accessory protein UreD n=1 Tax=Streptomyces sp. NPDC048361 TaxID=3154720 RepID=UPI00341BC522
MTAAAPRTRPASATEQPTPAPVVAGSRTDSGRTDEAPGVGWAHATDPELSGVEATAFIRASYDGTATTVPVRRNSGPFHLNQKRSHGGWARISVLSSMCAPLGGDRLALDITVEEHAKLEVTTPAATIALPGATAAPATYDVRLAVADQAMLTWLPKPLISTQGSTLHQTCTVDLAPTAAVIVREEQLLGRIPEPPGHLTTRLTVHRGGRPVIDQHASYGGTAPAWDGPAVLGRYRATGQLLVVDPCLATDHPPVLLGDDPDRGHAVLTPLARHPAYLATAAGRGLHDVSELLDAALEHIRNMGTGPESEPRVRK